VSCAACLRHHRNCDGTFSIEAFRKVGEQRKQLASKTRVKAREIVRLRKTLAAAAKVLADAEAEKADLEDSLALLEDRSSKMLRREMLALGVMDSLDSEQAVALAEPEFVWAGVPVTDSIDWEAVLGDIPAQDPG
jgi:hypothetical protein